MKQVSNIGPTNIRHYPTKFSHLGKPEPKICTALPLGVALVSVQQLQFLQK